jgi:tetratricopeptide (TPR) repeat protein
MHSLAFRLLSALLFVSVIFPSAPVFAAGNATLMEEFRKADYRDINKLRILLNRFAADIGNNPEAASTEELIFATDIASCLWNVTHAPGEQEKVAKLGYQWAQVLYKRESQNTSAIYFAGLNMLLYSQSKGVLDTLFALREVKKYFDAAYQKEPDFLHSSPPIGLGALYLFAPGFPIAFGDIDKAEQYLLEAVRQSPKNTTALVLLGAVYAKKGDRTVSLAAFRKVQKVPAWRNPSTVWEKDMDFWWHIDQIRALQAIRAYEAGEDSKKIFELVDNAVRNIKEPDLVKALANERAK